MGIRFHSRIIGNYSKHTKLVVWFIGLAGIALATGAITANSLSRATDAVTKATITPSVTATAQDVQVLANLSQNHSGTSLVGDTTEDDIDTDNPGVHVNVSMAQDEEPVISVNGQDVEAPASGRVHQNISTGSGTARVDVTTNDSTSSSTGDKNRTSASTSLRINSNTTVRHRTSTSN